MLTGQRVKEKEENKNEDEIMIENDFGRSVFLGVVINPRIWGHFDCKRVIYASQLECSQ